MLKITDILLVVITGIYALLTALIWMSNKKSTDLTEKMLEETRITRNLAYRPEVIAFFYKRSGVLYFQIKNIGSRLALDVTVTIDPAFKQYVFLTREDFMKKKDLYLEKKMKVLAPDQKVESYVQTYKEMLDNYNDSIRMNEQNSDSLNSTVYLSYRDYDGKIYKENYGVTLLDYGHHRGVIKYGLHEGVIALQKIEKKMK